MTTAVQRRRGTNTEHATFTGLDGEITVNTTTYTLHVHDGATVGGIVLAKADGSNIVTNSIDINGGTIDGTVIGGSSAAAGTFTSITGTSANINGTVTADGLTVSNSSLQVKLEEADGTYNPRLITYFDSSGTHLQHTWSSGADSLFVELGGAEGAGVKAMRIQNNDISFYEDTGTTAKFFWDASAESLTVGNASALTNTAGFSSTLGVKGFLPSITIEDTGTGTGKYTLGVTSGNLGVWDNTRNAYLLYGDSSGNLLVGKTTSSFATAGTTILPSGNVTFTRSGAGVIDVNRLSNDGSLINLFKDGTAVGSIGAFGGDLTLGTGITGIHFKDASDAIIPYNVSTGADRNGDIDLGLASNRFKDLRLSGIAYVGDQIRLGTTYTGASERFQIENVVAGGAAYGMFVQGDGINYTQYALRTYHNGSGAAQVGSITFNNTTTSYNITSDYRLKENVVSMDNASDRVLALNPVRFNFIADPEKTVDGFLAHEAQEVAPEAVTGSKDAMRTEEYEVSPAVLDEDGNVVTEAVMGTREVPDYQGIDQSKLVPLLTKALQEALQRIEALEAKLA